MNIELSVFITAVSVAASVLFNIITAKRNSKNDTKTDTAELTTVIVKLENIGNGISDIKNEMKSVKDDVKEDRETIIRMDESLKSAHLRISAIEKHRRDEGNE